MTELRPQPGKQEQFLSTPADIALYGGAAGGGKSFSLLLEPLRHIQNKDFGAVILRKEHTQLTKTGGLWDEALKIYPLLGAEPKVGSLTFKFQSGAEITLSGLGKEADLLKWQGSQIAFLGFDELTHFSFRQFFYMLSRNRSQCGVKPYVRATTNPDPDSWVRKFIDWWIDKDGYPIEERSGVLRYFVNDGGTIYWGDTKEELKKKFPHLESKSFTFIPAKLSDNKILMGKDPSYLSNLQALNEVDRARLLYGNWNARESEGMYFKRDFFEIVETASEDFERVARAWDFAATEPTPSNPDPDWTVGIKGGIDRNGIIYIIDMQRFRRESYMVEEIFRNVTIADGFNTIVSIPKDPGAAGKAITNRYIDIVRGYPVQVNIPSSKKELRALPASALAGARKIKLVRGDWNEAFLNELEIFPMGRHDDIVDALSDLVATLSKPKSAASTKINI